MAGLDCETGSDLGASCGFRTVLGSAGARASFGFDVGVGRFAGGARRVGALRWPGSGVEAFRAEAGADLF